MDGQQRKLHTRVHDGLCVLAGLGFLLRNVQRHSLTITLKPKTPLLGERRGRSCFEGLLLSQLQRLYSTSSPFLARFVETYHDQEHEKPELPVTHSTIPPNSRSHSAQKLQ